MQSVGLVAIGRNEGERLRRCLESAMGKAQAIVYVDSGSSDGSAAMAREMGIEVVELDGSVEFTAARGRNAGMEQLTRLRPGVEFVQFLDGDCELVEGWLEKGEAFLRENAAVAIVAGGVRERSAEASIYNRLCELEWRAAAGETRWCGGNVMVRAKAFAEVGGFNAGIVAGEEPELCVRLREKGWKIWRLAEDVAIHDADIKRFGQWWRRMMRAGHAFAEGAEMHGRKAERYCVREVWSGWAWGLALPLAALMLAWPTRGISVAAVLAVYGVQYFRMWGRIRGQRGAARCAALMVLGKVPQAMGQARYSMACFRKAKRAPLERASAVGAVSGSEAGR